MIIYSVSEWIIILFETFIAEVLAFISDFYAIRTPD